jgi:hypothetical protein
MGYPFIARAGAHDDVAEWAMNDNPESGPGFTNFTLCGMPVAQHKGKMPMLFITHAMPKNLLVDEIVRIGSGTLSAVSDAQDATKKEVEGGAHGT